MNDLVNTFVERFTANVWAMILVLLIICAFVLLFLWIICENANKALKSFVEMLRDGLRILPAEWQTAAGRGNVLMMLFTFLLTALSLASRAPADVICVILDRPDEAALLPFYFFVGLVVVGSLSVSGVAKLQRHESLARETTEGNQSDSEAARVS